MRKILFTLIILLCLTTVAFAEPFLVCDPAPSAEAITQVQVTRNGVAGAWIPYTTQTMGGTLVCVLQDLGPLSNGSYTVTAKFGNAWGESSSSSPFTFVKILPGAPSGMGIKR